MIIGLIAALILITVIVLIVCWSIRTAINTPLRQQKIEEIGVAIFGTVTVLYLLKFIIDAFAKGN
jgi:hypothetical protein